MEFNVFVGENLFDYGCVIGKGISCIDGLLKVIGCVFYVYECYDVVGDQLFGYLVLVIVLQGCIIVIDIVVVLVVFGVFGIVIVLEVGEMLYFFEQNVVLLFGGDWVYYYYQVIVVVVVEEFEQVCMVVVLVCVDYDVQIGVYDLDVVWQQKKGDYVDLVVRQGDFDVVFVQVVVMLDQEYCMFGYSYVMMEFYVSIVVWQDGKVIVWILNQMIVWNC